MNTKAKIGILSLVLALAGLPLTAHAKPSAAQDDVNTYLRSAKYEEGIKAYTKRVEQSHQQADLAALATLQFINGTQNVAQGLFRFALRSDYIDRLTQFTRLAIIPIPRNEQPQTVRPEDLALLARDWYDALKQTDKTLAEMSGEDFKLRLNLGQAAMDINCDGQVQETENLLQLCSRWFGGQLLPADRPAFYVNCDQADVLWLRGYCQLLMGLLDIVQAHDWSDFYAKTAHILFRSPDKAAFYSYERQKNDYIADAVTLIHALHLEVVHPEKYQQARDHFMEVIRLSRAFWVAVVKETDDDHEWIPNTQQTAASGANVTPQMILGWHFFLNEMENILNGRKVIPHHRIRREYGINLAKLIENPPALDLAEWFSGLAAVPYLEKGELTDSNNWDTLRGIFSGRFMRTAVWFN